MIAYLVLLWFPAASFGAYALSVSPDQIPSAAKRALYHAIFWPNAAIRGLGALYNHLLVKSPSALVKATALSQWFKG